MATQRWTDEMLDILVASLQIIRDTVVAQGHQYETLRETVVAQGHQCETLRETVVAHDRQYETLRETVIAHDRQFETLRETVVAHDRQNTERDQQMDLMAIGINRLLEDSREYRQWKLENDQRFNILLEEIRATNRRVEILENN